MATAPAEQLILAHTRAVGDVVTMTALVRDIHRRYPGRFRTAVDTTCKDVWQHNPYLEPLPPAGERKSAGWRRIELSYGGSLKTVHKVRTHFLLAWHTHFEQETGYPVPLTDPRPDLHLGPDEQRRIVEGRYWVVLPGGKGDFTTKWPLTSSVQAAVDYLRGLGLKFVQAGAVGGKPAHWNPELKGVTSLVGKTTLREYIRLIAQAEGVICTITSAMHIAAAFEKPAVVWAGGREEPWWEAYGNYFPGAFGPDAKPVRVEHRYLHTMGLLECSPWTGKVGCWANKCVPTGEDKSRCKLPVIAPSGQVVPKCQALITPEKIAESVLAYYLDGTLPAP